MTTPEPDRSDLAEQRASDRMLIEQLAAGAPESSERSCPCGGSLSGRRWFARYCSNACRQRAYRERRKRHG